VVEVLVGVVVVEEVEVVLGGTLVDEVDSGPRW
jgi:hypothetical protein